MSRLQPSHCERKPSVRDTPRSGRESGRARRPGVTLIELLMVLAMLGIITAMAVPKLNTSSFKSNASSRIFRAALQIAQRNAVTRQSNVIVSFDVTNKRLQVTEDVNDNGVADAGERVTNTPLESGTLLSPPPMGRVGGGGSVTAVAGSSLTSFNGMPSVIFRRDGSASSDVEIYITTRPTVTSDYRALMMTPSTGTVDFYRYTGSAWLRVQ